MTTSLYDPDLPPDIRVPRTQLPIAVGANENIVFLTAAREAIRRWRRPAVHRRRRRRGLGRV